MVVLVLQVLREPVGGGPGGRLDQHASGGVVVEKGGGHLGPACDGPDSDAPAFALELGDGFLDPAEFVLGLLPTSGDGCRGLG